MQDQELIGLLSPVKGVAHSASIVTRMTSYFLVVDEIASETARSSSTLGLELAYNDCRFLIRKFCLAAQYPSFG